MIKEYKGAAVESSTLNTVSTGATSITLTGSTGWPTGSPGPFVMEIYRLSDGASEKMLCSARSGNVITVTTRAYDGTTALTFAAGDRVRHVIDAQSLTDFIDTAEFVTTQNLTFHVDWTNGNDSNTGLSSGSKLKTLDAVMAKLPLIINHAIYVNIYGNYSAAMNVANKLGTGHIIIQGEDGIAANHTVNTASFARSVSCLLSFYYLKFTAQLTIERCLGTTVFTCHPQIPGGVGVLTVSSKAVVQSCVFSGSQIAILADSASVVTSVSNSGACTGSALRAERTSTIGKSGSQPTGSPNEEVLSAGVIR